MTAESERYRRSGAMIARRVAGEMLLVPVAGRTVLETRKSAELFVLNESGERMWGWLAEPSTLSDLARNLISTYEVTAESARADAVNFIESMREIGAVDVVQEG
jgi:hypothetical protein